MQLVALYLKNYHTISILLPKHKSLQHCIHLNIELRHDVLHGLINPSNSVLNAGL